MNKQEALEKLKKEIESTKLPLSESNLVFGEGNPDCTVMFIGEAPGFTENELKRPFVGRAGKLLDAGITSIEWKREDVYITNIVKRRPPDNRDPLPEEIEAYKPFLSRQIDIINPRIIATLGRFSMNYFLPLAKITRDQGKVFEQNGRTIYPVFHPAAALRNPSVMKEFKESFRKLPEVVAETLKPKESTQVKEEKIDRPKRPQKSLF